jgi:hypothetical protein
VYEGCVRRRRGMGGIERIADTCEKAVSGRGIAGM